MQLLITYALLILGTFVPNPVVFQDDGWELKKESEGIAIYTREVNHSNIKEFMASGEINTSIENMYKILRDVPNYPLWIEDVVFAEKIYEKKDSMGFYYQLNLPWPIKDRDMALIMTVNQHADGSITLFLNSSPKITPEIDDFLRMTNVIGQWHLEPISANKCHVTYQFLADPETFLPGWVINLFIVDGPFKTMENLNDYAQNFRD